VWRPRWQPGIPDLIIFVAAAALFIAAIAALLVGHLPKRMSEAASERRSGPLSTTILVIELALCASYIKDIIHELRWR
jgi:predicted lysophospholipase L1 biosynthesis ABC-type transport system permease subunit